MSAPASAVGAEPALLVIEAGKSARHYWRDLWRYRELFYFLAWRDILVRYKQTAIGIAWAVLRPLLTMLIFTAVFSRLARLPSDGVPYPILVLAALLPWQFVSAALSEAGNSLVGNANMVSKVYFPRLIIPASTVLVSLVDGVITGLLLAVLMAWYGVVPDARILVLPLFVLVAFALALGVGLWIAALNVKYRDFRYIIPFAVQLGLYVSPVGFSTSVIPERWSLLYALNPMVGIIDGFRWSLLATPGPLPWQSVTLSVVVSGLALASGVIHFRSTERKFADLI